jgi:hypothetical protein
VKGQPEIVLYADYNALPESPQFADYATLHTRRGRLCSSQEKSTRQPNPLQGLTNDARIERAGVGGNIGQFWHGYQLACDAHIFAMPPWTVGIANCELSSSALDRDPRLLQQPLAVSV